jgi:hypothetical protein
LHGGCDVWMLKNLPTTESICGRERDPTSWYIHIKVRPS